VTGWREAGEFVQHGNSPLSILHSQLNKAGALQLLGSNPEWCRKYGEADDDRLYTEREIGGKYEDSAKSFILKSIEYRVSRSTNLSYSSARLPGLNVNNSLFSVFNTYGVNV